MATKSRVAAVHSNGYVKAAFVRQGAEVSALVERLRAAGYWQNITVTEYIETPRRGGK